MSDIVAKRIEAVRKFCAASIEHDARSITGDMTDRAWCAQGVLNILDGFIDPQLLYEGSK